MVFMTFSLNHFLNLCANKTQVTKVKVWFILTLTVKMPCCTKLVKFRLDNQFNLFPGFCPIAISEISGFRVAERKSICKCIGYQP